MPQTSGDQVCTRKPAHHKSVMSESSGGLPAQNTPLSVQGAVVALFSEGADTMEIARRLGISEARAYNALHAAREYIWEGGK